MQHRRILRVSRQMGAIACLRVRKVARLVCGQSRFQLIFGHFSSIVATIETINVVHRMADSR
jgi:hypothetical protein